MRYHTDSSEISIVCGCGKITARPEDLVKPETLLADTGYFSAANVEACRAARIATGREAHYLCLAERFAEAPAAPDHPTPVETMVYRLKTPDGKKLYALRKQTPEPVFGIIKSVLRLARLRRWHDGRLPRRPGALIWRA